jgi:CRP/FNR family transcriptional regulator, putaive post-exponential-phase nitrogen-starvation regulator
VIFLDEQKLINYYLNRYSLSDILDQTMRDNLKIYTFSPGQHVVVSDEILEYFYFMVEGKAKVYSMQENGKSLLVRFYKPLEIIGEVELFSNNRSICNLQAITEVQCLGIRSEIVNEACQSNNRLLDYFCRSLSKKLLHFNISSSINLTYPLENRLAGYLMAVTVNEGKDPIVEQIFTENMTDLADLLGSSYRHLTRTLRIFINEGIISKKKKHIEILDWDKLSDMAKEIYT